MARNSDRRLLLVGAFVLVAVVGRAQVVTDGFSVVLERDGNTWSIECAEGCPFKKASTTVENPATQMRLDNRGLRTAASRHPADVRFSIGLTPRGNGWAAIGSRGTLWTELSIDCPSSPCRATVTDRGVRVESGRR